MKYNKKGNCGLFTKLCLSAITGGALCNIWYMFTISNPTYLSLSDSQSDLAVLDKEEETSDVASRLERIEMYQDRYRYKLPAPFRNHTARDDLCGYQCEQRAVNSVQQQRRCT